MPASWIRFFFWGYLLTMIWAEGTVVNPADPDLWHRFALGEYLLREHHFPTGDTFSYLADYQNIADHEWGCAPIFYALYTWGGGGALIGLKLVSLAVTLALVVWAGFHGRRPTVLFAAFYAVVIVAMLPAFQSTVRCLVFTHMFFALWLYWFQRERHGRPAPMAVWGYVGTMIVWANLHGGFALGLAWLLAVALVQFVLGQPWKRWAVRFGACLLASLVSPFGWKLWVSTARAMVTPRPDFVEWAPVRWWPHPFNYPGYKILVIVTVVWTIRLLWRQEWRRLDRTGLLLLGGALVFSLTSARHMSLFAVMAGALLPDSIFPERPIQSIANPLQRLGYLFMRFSIVLLPFYAVLIMLPGNWFHLNYPSDSCPAGSIDFLRQEGVRGKLLVPFNYGNYAMWQLRGEMRVSMDARYDLVYKLATYNKVEDFFAARGDWTALLRSPKPNAVLIPMADHAYPKMESQPGWREAYRDATDAVFLPR